MATSRMERGGPAPPGSPGGASKTARDPGVGGMVVDGLEVLRFHHEPVDPRVGLQPRRDVAHQVLDELRVVVGALGDVFFIGALEEAIELAGGFLFGDANDLGEVERRARRDGDRHRRALVVRAVFGDLLRARAQRRDRHRDRDVLPIPAVDELAGEAAW